MGIYLIHKKTMPKEITDLKDFIKIMRRDQDDKKHLPKAEKITIKKNKKTNITKFKLRTSKYLITLKVDGRVRAEKIKQSIPADLKKESKECSTQVYLNTMSLLLFAKRMARTF